MNKQKKLIVGLVAVAASVASFGAEAQMTSAAQSASPLRGIAAASFQAPVAFGADWGGVGVGGYVQTLDSDAFPDDDYDGALGVAMGLGNADKYVALEVSAGLTSLLRDSGNNEGFGESGLMGYKLHTNLPGYSAFAVGCIACFGKWGDAADASEHSLYAVGSKYFEIGNFDMIANLGVGDNAFSDDDDGGAGVFGSVSFYWMPGLSTIAEWTGRFANVAVSAAPFRSVPLTVTLGAVNLGDRFDLGTQAALSVGYGFSF